MDSTFDFHAKRLALAEALKRWSDHIIMALGNAVLAWSLLETSVDSLFECLMCRFHLSGVNALKLISANIGIREKCKVAVALAFELKLPDPITAEIVAVTNTVQNELRNERNRLFHDNWRPGFGGGITRLRTTGSQVRKPQPGCLELELPKPESVSPEDVQAFSNKCADASSKLLNLADVVLEWHGQFD